MGPGQICGHRNFIRVIPSARGINNRKRIQRTKQRTQNINSSTVDLQDIKQRNVEPKLPSCRNFVRLISFMDSVSWLFAQTFFNGK
jgi:hypothetical protein